MLSFAYAPPPNTYCGHTWFADPEKTTNIGDGQLTYKSKIPQAVWRIPTLIRTPTVDESFKAATLNVF